MENASLYGKGYLKTKEQPKKFNLFDTPPTPTKPNIYAPILNKGPASLQIPKSIQAGLSVKKGPASVQVPKVIQQAQQVTGKVARLGTQSQAGNKDLIQTFLDDSKGNKELESRRNAVIEMIKNQEDTTFIEDTIVNKMGYTGIKPKEQGFLGGVAEKTGEAFMGGLGRIKEAGVGLAEGKYDFGEAAVRGGAGALQSTFSPITGALGQTIETVVPDSFKQFIATKTKPTVEDVKTWYNSQTPEQKRRLDNIGVGVELLANFVGAKGVQKATPIIKETGKKTAVQLAKQGQKISKGLENVKVNRATNQITKGEDILYEAVNPTTRENKAVLKQRVQDLLPYIEKNPIKNSLEEVKARIDTNKIKAGKSIQEYENTVGVKGTVKTNDIIKKLKETYQEKVGDSFINPDEAKISQDLINTLKGFGKEVKDNDLIKIRRAWDKIEKKNKGFMQSAEATSKGDIFGDANKFFREEIKKSNPKYAKYLQDYHKTTTLSDVIEATIQRRVGQTKGGFLKRGLQNVGRIAGSTGGLPGYLGAEALIQGGELLASPGFKLTRGAKLLKKGQETLKTLKPKALKPKK